MKYAKGIFLTESELRWLTTLMELEMEDNCDDKRKFQYRNAKKLYERLTQK